MNKIEQLEKILNELGLNVSVNYNVDDEADQIWIDTNQYITTNEKGEEAHENKKMSMVIYKDNTDLYKCEIVEFLD
jgi:hypothetical protein